MRKRLVLTLLAGALLLAGCGPAAPAKVEEPPMTFQDSDSINDGRPEAALFEIPASDFPEIPNVFGDNMLFQQGKPVRVWGLAPALAKVEIRLREQESGKLVSQLGLYAADDGSFIGELPAVSASFTAHTLEIRVGSFVKTCRNVLFGELLLASGQSNMQVVVNDLYERDALLAAADNPHLRFYNPPIMPVQTVDYVSEAYPFLPQLSPEMGAMSWVRGDEPTTMGVGGVSGVAYTCALELYERLNRGGRAVPVGVMNLPVGGTSIVPWLPRYTATEDAAFRSLLGENFAETAADYNHNANFPAHSQFSSLFNTKIAPVVNMRIAGLLWYQGESDAGNPAFYEPALEKLLDSWAAEFGEEALYAVLCHIAPFNTATADQNVTGQQVFNELFTKSAKERPDVRAAVATYDQDLSYERGDNEPIHPKVKEGVGRRCGMSLYALRYDDGARDLLAPEVRSCEPAGTRMKVTFAHAGGGLKTKDGLPVRGFAVAGADGLYYAGRADIEGDSVYVSSPEVASPVSVSYAYTNMNVSANLQNAAGVAALPFRTAATNREWCQHDWLSCDIAEVWRYLREKGTDGVERVVGRSVLLFVGENCTLSLTEQALRGRALRLTGTGESCAVSVPLNYPYDVHQFNRYRTLTVRYQGTLTGVWLDGTALERVSEGKEGDWQVAVFRLDAKPWDALLQKLTFTFAGSSATLDEIDLGNRLPT